MASKGKQVRKYTTTNNNGLFRTIAAGTYREQTVARELFFACRCSLGVLLMPPTKNETFR